jgi:hypothetical protein
MSYLAGVAASGWLVCSYRENAIHGGNLLLAAALAALPLLERRAPTTDEWLAIGLGFALAGVAVLGVAVLALAREIGMLRLGLPAVGALEIPHEGPELGGRTALASAFDGAELGLAVFTSEGCGMCRQLAPGIEAFGRSPHVSLVTLDEVDEGDPVVQPVSGVAQLRRSDCGHLLEGGAGEVEVLLDPLGSDTVSNHHLHSRAPWVG